MSDLAYELDVKKLKQLIKAFKGTTPTAQVGIAGGSARKDGKTNAEVGAVHEYGSATCPMRSFLRMPIAEKLSSYLENSGAFTKETLAEVVRLGSILPWMNKIAITGERVVADAFDTGGFGKWQALNPETLSRKTVHQILVETHQLRDSITSEVK